MIDYEVVGRLDENSYIVYNDDFDDCILIDPGDEPSKIEEMCNRAGKTPRYILLTHGHFDHIGAAKYFQDKGAIVYVHEEDSKRLQYDRMAELFGVNCEWLSADKYVHDGDILDIIGYKIRVMHTPGHSAGSVIYIFDEERAIFAGDTIFFRSYGRCDFRGGSKDDLRKSFRKIYAIEGVDEYTVYSGHGISTTLGYEKKYNAINEEL